VIARLRLRIAGDEEETDSINIRYDRRKWWLQDRLKRNRRSGLRLRGATSYYDLAVCTAIFLTISEYRKYRYFTY
jgi:hypothetical protein